MTPVGREPGQPGAQAESTAGYPPQHDDQPASSAGSNKQWLRLTVALGLLAIAAFFITAFRLPPHLILDTGVNTEAAGPVTATKMLIQPLDPDGRSRVTAVEVLLATWGKATNSTHDRLTVYDDTGATVATSALPPGSVADNAYRRVALEPGVDLGTDARLYVALSSDGGSKEHSITAWSTERQAQSPYYVLSKTSATRGSPVAELARARPRAGTLCVRVYGLGPHALAAERALAVVGFVICLVAAAVLAFYSPLAGSSSVGRRIARLGRRVSAHGGLLDRLSVQNVYLVVALVWGLTMVFLVPPFQVPDEPAHYYRAWSVAELQLFAHTGQTVTLPENVASLPERLGSAVMDWGTNHYSSRNARALVWEPLSPRLKEQWTSAGSYGPIGYAPQVAGIEIARFLGHSPLLGLYFARALNLAASVLIMFFAIRLLPFGKPLMALVGLLPMTVAQMASVSPDGIALSGALLVTAVVLNLAQRRTISSQNMIWLAIAASLLLTTKPGYALMALLVLAFVPGQFGGMRRWIVSECAVLAAVFSVAAILLAMAPRASSATLAGLGVQGVDQAAQLSLVMHNPLIFLQVLSATLDANGLSLAQMTYGILGWLTVGLPMAGMVVAALAVILLLGRDEPITTSPWQRCVLAGTAGVLAGAINLALYMGWSAVGATVISGLQGRYFIPVVMLGLLSIYGIRLTRQRTLVAMLLVVAIVFMATTIRALMKFYY